MKATGALKSSQEESFVGKDGHFAKSGLYGEYEATAGSWLKTKTEANSDPGYPEVTKIQPISTSEAIQY